MAKIYEFPNSNQSKNEETNDESGSSSTDGGSTGTGGIIRSPEQYQQLLGILLQAFDIQRMTHVGLANADLTLLRDPPKGQNGMPLKAQKILQKAKQFSGIPKHMSANAANNKQAQTQNAERLENQLRKRLGMSMDPSTPKNSL